MINTPEQAAKPPAPVLFCAPSRRGARARPGFASRRAKRLGSAAGFCAPPRKKNFTNRRGCSIIELALGRTAGSCATARQIPGLWRSWLSRYTGSVEITGSNPVSSTRCSRRNMAAKRPAIAGLFVPLWPFCSPPAAGGKAFAACRPGRRRRRATVWRRQRSARSSPGCINGGQVGKITIRLRFDADLFTWDTLKLWMEVFVWQGTGYWSWRTTRRSPASS